MSFIGGYPCSNTTCNVYSIDRQFETVYAVLWSPLHTTCCTHLCLQRIIYIILCPIDLCEPIDVLVLDPFTSKCSYVDVDDMSFLHLITDCYSLGAAVPESAIYKCLNCSVSGLVPGSGRVRLVPNQQNNVLSHKQRSLLCKRRDQVVWWIHWVVVSNKVV